MFEIAHRRMCELEVCNNRTWFPLASTAIRSAASMKRIFVLVLIAIRADLLAAGGVWHEYLRGLVDRPATCSRNPALRGARMHSSEASSALSISCPVTIAVACSYRVGSGTETCFSSASCSRSAFSTSRIWGWRQKPSTTARSKLLTSVYKAAYWVHTIVNQL